MQLVMLLLIGSVALLGYAAGTIYRKNKLRKIRRAYPQKVRYTIMHDISPAEFGCIVDGTIGYKELVGEVILLYMQGAVKLTKGPSGKFFVDNTYTRTTKLTLVQQAILKEIGAGQVSLYALQPALEYAVRQSLTQKGWIVTKRPFIRGLTYLQDIYLIGGIAAGIAVGGIAGLCAALAGATGEDVYIIVLTTLLVELLLAMFAGLAAIFRGEMLQSARLALAATTKYAQEWKDVYGVYEYLRISGMDIFTPDYTTLNLKGIDPLYPYAVAAGLDKQVLKIFA
jgi:hypothetical protein